MTDDRIQEIAERRAQLAVDRWLDSPGHHPLWRGAADAIKGDLERYVADAVAAALREAARERWVSVAERLPEPGVPVLICVTNTNGFHRRLRAEWSDGKSLPVGYDDPSDFGVYDEATDMTWCPEGWYESNEYEETHWTVGDPVSHWQPLPRAPKDGLPAPPEVEP